MLGRTLLPLLAAALSILVLCPAQAQVKKAGMQKAPTKSTSSVESEVVGSVNGKVVMTFGQLVEKLRKENPLAFTAAVGEAVGAKTAQTLFMGPLKSQISFTRSDVLTEMRKRPAQALSGTLANAVQVEAINQEAVKMGAQPTDAQITDLISFSIKQARNNPNAHIPPTMTDDQFLAQQNMTRAKLKNLFKPRVILQNLAQKEIEKKLGHTLSPDDYVKARHILISVPPLTPTAKPEEKKADADALAKLIKIAADIKSGKVTFEQAAKENSEDPGSKDNGGDLGIFMRDGSMVKEFQDTAFKLKSGETSAPVRSQFGYHLIQVTKSGKELTQDERQTYLLNAENKQVGLLVATITRSAKIVNKLAPETPQMPFPGGQNPGQ